MKTAGYLLGSLLLLCTACKKQPLLYTVALDEGVSVTGEIWKKGEANTYYTDVYITDRYYVFSEYDSDTVLQAFDKTDPAHCKGFEIKHRNDRLFYSIDFIKSNSRYESDKDDIWFVDSKRELKQLRLLHDSLVPVNTWPLSKETMRSSSYNFTQKEMYAVPTNGRVLNSFYFFQPDSGYYWIEMYGTKDKLRYKQNPEAYLSNLCVNEKKNAVACAFLFFNQIQFFDLRGNIIRSVTIGNEKIVPANTGEGHLDYANSAKCFIDICSTDKYVYCLYDGSTAFNKTSLIFVFNWKGTYVGTYRTDRVLKKIAIDKTSNKIVALALNNQENRDVVHYPIK